MRTTSGRVATEVAAGAVGEVRVRGDAWLTLRLLARRQGRAGMVVALAGGLVLASALLPWVRATATVDLLGRDATARLGHTVLTHQVWGVLVLAAALALVVVGVGIAVDRPVARPPRVVAAAVALAAIGALGATLPPPTVTGVAPAGAADLEAVATDLPADVGLTTGVRAGPGPALLVTGLVAAVLGARIARDDRRGTRPSTS